MTKKIIITIFLNLPLFILSQTNAVTDHGDQVILYDDGTWKYIEENIIIMDTIPTNPKVFKVHDKSKFLLKSSNIDVGFWLNAKEWKFEKTPNDDGEYELNFRKGDLYGKVITEKVEVPLESLKNIVLSNAREVAPDTNIDYNEYRIVNGLKVLMIEMSGTMTGIKFSYKGYFYSNFNGTVQIIIFTATNLIKSFDDKIENLLNGLVLLE